MKLKLSQKLLQQIKKWSQKNLEENIPLITYRCIQDLRVVGIRLKSSKTQRPTKIDISAGWSAAKLTLHQIYVDNSTTVSFLNLIACEMCPNYENDYVLCSCNIPPISYWNIIRRTCHMTNVQGIHL